MTFKKYILIIKIFFSFSGAAQVISTSPALTETLFEMNLGKDVVAVSQYCNFPEKIRKLPRIGTPFTPNYELIAKLKPALVITQSVKDDKFVLHLEKLKIKTLNIPLNSYGTILESLDLIGAELGGNGSFLKSEIRKEEQKLRSLKKKGNYALAIGTQKAAGMVRGATLAGDNTYLAEIINFTGLKNSGANLKGYQRVSLESLIKMKPEYIFLFIEGSVKEVVLFEKSLSKVLGKEVPKIILMNQNYASIPSSRIRFLMGDLFKILKDSP